MADLKELVLKAVEEHGELNTRAFSVAIGVHHEIIVGAMKSLESLGDVRYLSYIYIYAFLQVFDLFYRCFNDDEVEVLDLLDPAYNNINTLCTYLCYEIKIYS